jgi:protein O-mannosyl-transferase
MLKNRSCVLLVLFISISLYYPALFAPYNSVDDVQMVNGLLNVDHLDLKALFLPGSSGYYYRPLIGLSFWLDKYLWGLEQSFMHLENLLIHALNAVLVFFLALQLLKRQGSAEGEGRYAALFAALLFAVHPINTEAVNWISGRTDPLAASFLLLSLIALYRSLDRDSLALALVSVSAMVTACLAKETAIFLAPAALFIIFCHYRKMDRSRPLFRELLFHSLFVAGTGGYFLLRRLAFARGDTGISTAAGMLTGAETDHLYTLKVILKVSGFYAKKLLAPWPLNFAIVEVPDYYILAGVPVVCLTLYILIRRREDAAALAMATVVLASSALLVVLGRMAWTPVSERYLYLPCAIFAVGLTVLLAPLLARRNLAKLRLPVAVLVLAPLFWSSYQRTLLWQDNVAFFAATAKESPKSQGARNDLAVALLKQGQTQQAYAIFTSNAASSGAKNSELAEMNKAMAQKGGGDLEGARKTLLALLGHPGKQEVGVLQKLLALNQARVEKAVGQREKGAIYLEMAGHLERLQKVTGDPFCHYRLGQLYLVLQRKEEARVCFARAYREAPAGAYYKAPARKLAGLPG